MDDWKTPGYWTRQSVRTDTSALVSYYFWGLTGLTARIKEADRVCKITNLTGRNLLMIYIQYNRVFLVLISIPYVLNVLVVSSYHFPRWMCRSSLKCIGHSFTVTWSQQWNFLAVGRDSLPLIIRAQRLVIDISFFNTLVIILFDLPITYFFAPWKSARRLQQLQRRIKYGGLLNTFHRGLLRFVTTHCWADYFVDGRIGSSKSFRSYRTYERSWTGIHRHHLVSLNSNLMFDGKLTTWTGIGMPVGGHLISLLKWSRPVRVSLG